MHSLVISLTSNHLSLLFINCYDFAILKFLSYSISISGLHTPGVFTALLQIGPAYTGSITGIAFSAGHTAKLVANLTIAKLSAYQQILSLC